MSEEGKEAAPRGGLWLLREGKQKYLVLRRDGTVPEWPYFVLGAGDPAVPEGLLAYAASCERMGYHADYVADVRQFAMHMITWREAHRQGDPDAKRHRKDHPLFGLFSEQGLAAIDLDPDQEGGEVVTNTQTGRRYLIVALPLPDQE